MSKKIWLIIAAFLILVGAIICGAVMMVQNWDFNKLSAGKYETSRYDFNGGYQGISIATDTADITFLPSKSEMTLVECYERIDAKHLVSVRDGTLFVEIEDTRKWYEHISIFSRTPTITIHLPASEYAALSITSGTGDLTIPEQFKFETVDISKSTGDVSCAASAQGMMKIKTTTGDIRVENISAGMLDLTVSTGNMTVSGVTCDGGVNINVSTGKANITDLNCQSFSSDGSTGDLSLKRVIATGALFAQRSTGDVKLDACDAAELFLKTSTGDITGSLLTDKVFITESDTGDVDVPKTTTGGKCEISTNTGDITIKITS